MRPKIMKDTAELVRDVVKYIKVIAQQIKNLPLSTSHVISSI